MTPHDQLGQALPLSSGDAPIPEALQRAIDHALAHATAPPVPSGFAERVAHLAAQQPVTGAAPWLGWGPRLALLSGLLLTIGMFVIAPHAVPTLTDARFDAEMVLLAELGSLLLFAPRLLPRR